MRDLGLLIDWECVLKLFIKILINLLNRDSLQENK